MHAFVLPRASVAPSTSQPAVTLCPGASSSLPVAAAQPREGRSALCKAVAFATVAGMTVGSRRKRVARRVTLEEIDALTVDDVPEFYQHKVAVKEAQEIGLKWAIRDLLDNTYLLFAFNHAALKFEQMNDIKGTKFFPAEVTIKTLRQSMVREAMEGTGWEAFGERLTAPLTFVFVPSEDLVKTCIKAYNEMDKEFARKAYIDPILENLALTTPQKYADVDAGAVGYLPLFGGILRDEWQFIESKDMKKLEDFVSKQDLMANVAGAIKQIPTRLARVTKQVPQKLATATGQLPKKLAVGAKALVDKMEKEGKGTIGELAA